MGGILFLMENIFTVDIRLKGCKRQDLRHHKLCEKSWLYYRVKAITKQIKGVEKGSSVGSPIFLHGFTALVGQGLLIFELPLPHSGTPRSVGLLWTSDRTVAHTST
jgi:hypothetical protein